MSPEVQMAIASLREGERARVEKALGAIGALPLYRADLVFDPRTRIVTGKVLITLTPKKESLTEIFLRITPNASNEGSVKLSQAQVNGAPAKLSQPDVSLYRVGLAKPSPVGVPVTVELRVASKVPEGDLTDAMGGLDDAAPGDYGAYSVTPEVSCLAGIIPMVPFVRANGELAAGPSGIGDLGTFDPSNFVVSLVVPSGYSVIAPGNLLGEVPEAGGTRFTYALAAARELPILVTKGYQMAMSTVGEVTIESHFSSKDAAIGKKVLEHATNAVRVAQEKLGPLPYRRFRVVEAHLSHGAGGMEFPGLITVAASLYRGSTNPLAAMGMPDLSNNPLLAPLFAQSLGAMMANTIEFTVDHEVAHQYIAMLVGSDPIEEPIADEPLTQAVALRIMEWQRKPELANEIRNSQIKMAFQMMRLMNRPDAKANRPTSEYTNNVEYAGLVYGKAALLFDAQRALVGVNAFDEALRQYVEEHRYKWVTAKTFTSVLGRVTPSQAGPLEKLRKRWWEERHGDEDIGGFNLDSLLDLDDAQLGKAAGAQGAPGAPPVDPKLLEQYNAAMKALMGE